MRLVGHISITFSKAGESKPLWMDFCSKGLHVTMLTVQPRRQKQVMLNKEIEQYVMLSQGC